MEHCIFCRIIAGEIPSKKVYEDENIIAFEDIDAKAPVHILIIPKKHVQSVLDLTEGDDAMVTGMMRAAKQLADEFGIAKTGFRLVCNTGEDAGQSVAHLHLHLLGGRSLAWPPG